jgi:purine nucleotide phosphorylase
MSGFKPQVGLVLGSGLGAFVNYVERFVSIEFCELPGFFTAGVGSHAGRLVLGYVGAVRVAVLQGRTHYYENGQADAMVVPIQTLKAIGCESLVLTNAAGSLLQEVGPGHIMLLTDHINMTGQSPLFGVQGNTRFVNMVNAYDLQLSGLMRQVAQQKKLSLCDGVYAWMSGPQFETPAEINALRVLGADAVGMSTVPEVIIARHQGLRVVALSIITNHAAGMAATPLSHEHTITSAAKAINAMHSLLTGYLAQYKAL